MFPLQLSQSVSETWVILIYSNNLLTSLLVLLVVCLKSKSYIRGRLESHAGCEPRHLPCSCFLVALLYSPYWYQLHGQVHLLAVQPVLQTLSDMSLKSASRVQCCFVEQIERSHLQRYRWVRMIGTTNLVVHGVIWEQGVTVCHDQIY